MTRGIEAKVEPALLAWARKSAGYDFDVAATKLTLPKERLVAWEKGEAKPSLTQLRKLGNLYKRPIAVFYLPEPPEEFQAIKDFRRLPGRVSGVLSPELRYEIRRAYSRRDIAVDLMNDLQIEKTKFSLKISLNDDPEKIAASVRRILEVEYDDQVLWKPGYEAFNYWREALENANIFVFQCVGVDTSEVRGFSITDGDFPAIVVNISDSPQARTFTMLHELTHVMLQKGGLCDLDEEWERPPEDQKIEVFCNRVAGAILVPSQYLLKEDIVKSKGNKSIWDDREIRKLADRYGVSRDVLLRRLQLLGFISMPIYKQKYEALQEEYAEKRKQYEQLKAAGKVTGFAPPFRMAMSSSGPYFLGLVLDGYHSNKITAGDVSDYLGIRLKHLERIQSEFSFDRKRRWSGF